MESPVKELQKRGCRRQTHDTVRDVDWQQHDRRGSQKYSTREFKDYPKMESAPRTREYNAYNVGFNFSAKKYTKYKCILHEYLAGDDGLTIAEFVASMSHCAKNITKTHGDFLGKKVTVLLFTVHAQQHA